MSGSRVYAATVLRPLAEQLIVLEAIGSGMTVLDVLAGSGRLTRELAAAVAPAAVVAVEDDPARAAALRTELAAERLPATVVVAAPGTLPFESGGLDIAVALLGITAARGGTALLAEMQRVARRGAAVVWDGAATAENALLDAWLAVTGHPPAALSGALTAPPPPSPTWRRQPLADVARFDSVAQLVAALSEHHGLTTPADLAAALEPHLHAALARYIAADGTLRLPIRATVLRFG